jgi:hypothetical protein
MIEPNIKVTILKNDGISLNFLAEADFNAEASIHTCTLADYDTAEKVVDYFDSLPDMTAAIVTGYENKPTVASLDYVTDADITSSYDVTANLQAIVDYINSLLETEVGYVIPVMHRDLHVCMHVRMCVCVYAYTA